MLRNITTSLINGVDNLPEEILAENIKFYTSLIASDPTHTIAYNNRGCCYTAQNNLDEAIEDYNQAIILNPHYTSAYLNRGFCYFMLNKYTKANNDTNSAIELDPNNAVAYNNRGFLHCMKDDFTKAMSDYNKSIELNNNFSLAYHNRASLHNKLSNYIEAIADATKAIELNNNCYYAYLGRGLIYINIRNYTNALIDINRSIVLSPRNTRARYYRGVIHELSKNYTAAIIDYKSAIKLNLTSHTLGEGTLYDLPFMLMECYIKRSKLHFNQYKIADYLADSARAGVIHRNTLGFDYTAKIDRYSVMAIYYAILINANKKVIFLLLADALNIKTPLGAKLASTDGSVPVRFNPLENLIKLNTQLKKDQIEVKKAARLMAQVARNPSSFFGIPDELGVLIARHAAVALPESVAHKIAFEYYGRP